MRTPRPGPVTALDGVVITAAGIEAFDCPQCGDARDLVVPDGDGGTGGESTDRACAECGFALVLGGLPSLWRTAGSDDERRPVRRAG